MTNRTRNILVSPVVFFVRMPLMMALRAVVFIGWCADYLYDIVDCYVPGMRR